MAECFDLAPTGATCYTDSSGGRCKQRVLISPPPGPPATVSLALLRDDGGFDLAPTGATCYTRGQLLRRGLCVLISPPPGPPATRLGDVGAVRVVF